MAPLLGSEEQNTQITATDEYGAVLLSTQHDTSENNGNSITSNKNASTEKIVSQNWHNYTKLFGTHIRCQLP